MSLYYAVTSRVSMTSCCDNVVASMHRVVTRGSVYDACDSVHQVVTRMSVSMYHK